MTDKAKKSTSAKKGTSKKSDDKKEPSKKANLKTYRNLTLPFGKRGQSMDLDPNDPKTKQWLQKKQIKEA